LSCAGFGLALGFLELLRLWFQILHDYGAATVGCIERLSGRAQHLIGIASDFRNLVAPQSVVLHQSSGGIGAVGGELPIPVFAAARVGLGIGVTFDGAITMAPWWVTLARTGHSQKLANDLHS
jgi:hypothetical protein